MQVLFPDDEYKQVLRTTRKLGVSVADWIRELVSRGLREGQPISSSDRLARLLQYAKYKGPTGDIEDVLLQIETGREGR